MRVFVFLLLAIYRTKEIYYSENEFSKNVKCGGKSCFNSAVEIIILKGGGGVPLKKVETKGRIETRLMQGDPIDLK